MEQDVPRCLEFLGRGLIQKSRLVSRFGPEILKTRLVSLEEAVSEPMRDGSVEPEVKEPDLVGGTWQGRAVAHETHFHFTSAPTPPISQRSQSLLVGRLIFSPYPLFFFNYSA